MIGLIVSGHGNFATGLLSAAEVIAGKQDRVVAIDFLSGDSSEGLHEKIVQAIKDLACEAVVLLTDIAGGTPFNQSVLISGTIDCECRVFSGTNMPLLLEAIFGRDCDHVDELAQSILASEQAKVQLYTEKKRARVSRESGGI